MPSLKLLADDLTGALDTSAELVGAFGPMPVVWAAASHPAAGQSLVIDSGTRELGPDEAFAVVRGIAPRLVGADIAYKKIDSRLRGPWVAELEACLGTGAWDACIVAPAFPHQGRRTFEGRQYVRAVDGGWSAAGDDILLQLRSRGLEARLANRTAGLGGGISVFDAENDRDLDRIVQIGREYRGRVLWCGSGGLAGALARSTDASVPHQFNAPVLGVFGSDHPATAAQLSMCESVLIRASDAKSGIERVKRAMEKGVAFVALETPGAVSREKAAGHFSREIMLLAQSIDPPKTLIAAGGETLKAQCVAAGAQALQVLGRLEPGLPKSVIQGGPWDGVDVISKSGAFGPPDLWWKLLRQNRLI
jgi:D-threonate/D-erythronate kinase